MGLVAHWLKAGANDELRITSTVATTSIAVGQYVCRTGYVQQNRCGKITDTDYANGGNLHMKAAKVCSGDGDSGGPWWDPANGRAYGINVGSSVGGTTCPNNDVAWFTPIRDAEFYLGANVLIKGGKTSRPAIRRGNLSMLNPIAQDTIFAPINFNFANPDDVPVYCDWNGDGLKTIGVFRNSNATFYLRNTNSDGTPDYTIQFGSPGNQPLCGDWDGDGFASIGVYQSGTFYLRNALSPGGPSYQFAYGDPTGDTPLVGDWDGNGTTTAGIWRPVSTVGEFHLRNEHSGGAANVSVSWGNNTDVPVVGNWDGDNDDNFGVARLQSQAGGTYYTWYLNGTNASAPHIHSFFFGVPGDVLRTW